MLKVPQLPANQSTVEIFGYFGRAKRLHMSFFEDHPASHVTIANFALCDCNLIPNNLVGKTTTCVS